MSSDSSTHPFEEPGVTIDFGPDPPRECNRCHVVQPREAFRDDPRGYPREICRECERHNPDHRRQRDLAAGLRGLVARANRQTTKPADLSEFCNEMLDKFKGLSEFCQFWHQQIQTAATEKPGSKTVLDSCYTIYKMHVAAATEQRERIPLETATEQELEEAITSFALSVVRAPEDGEAEIAECA